MEGLASNPVTGDALAQEVDKKGKKSLPQSGFSVASLFKNLHLGKVTSQHQHESEITKPLEGHLESKDFGSRSDAFGASAFQSSHTYICGGIKLVFHDMGLDANLSTVLTHLLECHKHLFREVKELANIFLQTPICSCINQDGRGSMPCTLILSIEPTDVRGITCDESPGRVKLTEHTNILHVPLANPYTFTEEVTKEIVEKFQFHYNEGIRVVYPLRQRFFVTTIKSEKLMNVMNRSSWGSDKHDEDRGSTSKKEGEKKHTQARDEFGGQGEAPTSSSARGKEGGKTLRSGVQKQVVVKIKKY